MGRTLACNEPDLPKMLRRFRGDIHERDRSGTLPTVARDGYRVMTTLAQGTSGTPVRLGVRPRARSARNFVHTNRAPALPVVAQLDRIRHQDLSCAYFSNSSRLYSSLTALRETCPLRSLAIFRRSGSVGARDFRLNLAKSRVAGADVLPNSRSNHPIVSFRTEANDKHYHHVFAGQTDSATGTL